MSLQTKPAAKISRNLLTIMYLLHKCDIIMSIVICAPDASRRFAMSNLLYLYSCVLFSA